MIDFLRWYENDRCPNPKWPILKWPILARLHQNDRCCSKMTDSWAKMTDSWAKMTDYLRKWPIPNSKTWKIRNRSFWLVRKWPIVDTKMTDWWQNDRLRSKMTDSKIVRLSKMTDYRTKMTDTEIFNTSYTTKMTDYANENDRFYVPKWPILRTKMTDYNPNPEP